MNALGDIKQSLVLMKKNDKGDHKMIAFYVSENKISSKFLIEQLKTKLPYEMIPSFFVHLKKLPMIYGKPDSDALLRLKIEQDEEK